MNVDIETIKSKADIAMATGARVEIVGSWVWASFPARPPRETRDALKLAGFHWNKKRECWQFAGTPARYSREDSETLKAKYGAVRLA